LLKACVNGCEITIKAPRNKTRSPLEQQKPRKQYQISDGYFNRAVTGQPNWESFALIARWWDFNGPWFTGNLARLGMFVGIMRPLHSNPEASFFHPRAFEAAIADLMTYYHGEELSRNSSAQDWFAPVNWQPLSHLPCIAAKFDATANRDVRRDKLERYIISPLSDQYLLVISFSINRNPAYIYPDKGPEKDTDKWTSEEPLKVLADQIINSFQIKLSPEAEQQQAKALAGLSEKERALVAELPPLKWV
jgi:hypothetical protein